MQVQNLERVFKYNGATLPDPNPEFTIEQVRDTYVAAYPELATATIQGPEATNTGMQYTFVRSVGVKS